MQFSQPVPPPQTSVNIALESPVAGQSRASYSMISEPLLLLLSLSLINWSSYHQFDNNSPKKTVGTGNYKCEMDKSMMAPAEEADEYNSIGVVQNRPYDVRPETGRYREDENVESKDNHQFEYPIFEDVPSHQLPNFSTIFGAFGSMEQDYIKQAYNSASFTSLRKLPNQLRYGEVFLARQNQILKTQLGNPALSASQINGASTGRLQSKSLGSSTRVRALRLFQEFKYIPSRYSLAEEAKAQERQTAEEKRLRISGKAFAPTSTRTKAKYEDTFEDEDYRFPYCSDPFELSRDQVSMSSIHGYGF